MLAARKSRLPKLEWRISGSAGQQHVPYSNWCHYFWPGALSVLSITQNCPQAKRLHSDSQRDIKAIFNMIKHLEVDGCCAVKVLKLLSPSLPQDYRPTVLMTSHFIPQVCRRESSRTWSGRTIEPFVNTMNNVSSQQKTSLHNEWNKIQGLQPETWQLHTQKILPASQQQQQPPPLPQVTTKVHPGPAAHISCPWSLSRCSWTWIDPTWCWKRVSQPCLVPPAYNNPNHTGHITDHVWITALYTDGHEVFLTRTACQEHNHVWLKRTSGRHIKALQWHRGLYDEQQKEEVQYCRIYLQMNLAILLFYCQQEQKHKSDAL